jgi:hypothetical protein
MSPERHRAVTTLLLIVVVILLGQAVWQQTRLRSLKAQLGYALRHSDEQAGRMASERLLGRREDIVRTSQWLHDYYASDEGLRRSDGLWLRDQKKPDFEAIGAWVFDVYLTARVNGASDADARQAIVDAIHGTDEWRRVHAR